jgi:hypothetical protein
MNSKTSTSDPGVFTIEHFFILVSLLGATAAVVMARQTAPENLILLSGAVGAAGLAGIAFYRTIAPLIGTDARFAQQSISDRLRADLEREKMLTLRSIKELEFDRAMGKLSPQDFDEMAGRLRARAIGIMKQLDAPAPAQTAAPQPAGAGGVSAASTPASPVCACGTANDADARFCKTCGRKLSETTA